MLSLRTVRASHPNSLANFCPATARACKLLSWKTSKHAGDDDSTDAENDAVDDDDDFNDVDVSDDDADDETTTTIMMMMMMMKMKMMMIGFGDRDFDGIYD